jgi:hypothetical protein
MIPPASGCVSHRGTLHVIALEPCDESRPEQYWAWEASASQLRFSQDPSQCLSWFADTDAFGAWPCEFADAEFEFEPLAHRFCLSSSPSRCVSQLLAAEPMLLRSGDASARPPPGPTPGLASGLAPGLASGLASGPPTCLAYAGAGVALVRAPCNETSAAQLWEYDVTSLAFHARNDRAQCLDWYADL